MKSTAAKISNRPLPAIQTLDIRLEVLQCCTKGGGQLPLAAASQGIGHRVIGEAPSVTACVMLTKLLISVASNHTRSPALLSALAICCGHSQFLGYLVAGADGSPERGRRRFNWVWYRQLTAEQLAAALTSDAGMRREYSVPFSGLSATTKKELRLAAENLLPRVLANIVTQEEFPFLQAIFDYEAPRMRSGRAILLGDAAYVVRPHTAMGVSKAAGDAMALRDALSQEVSLHFALERYNGVRTAAGLAIARYGQRLGERLTHHA